MHALLKNELYLTAEDILLRVENRNQSKYNNDLKQEQKSRNQILISNGQQPITLEELKLEFPIKASSFENRDLNYPSEHTLIDVLAEMKGRKLETMQEYNAFQGEVYALLIQNTNICESMKSLYGMKQISDLLSLEK